MLTQAYVRELFDYFSETGDLIWKVKRGNVKVGDVAGRIDGSGYYSIQVDGKQYKVHRLVYLYHHGYLPKYIDHINRDRSDNRIENLREATDSQNNINAPKHRNNTSGWKGVSWFQRDKKWRAKIQVNRKTKHLGYFSNPEDAAMMYNQAALENFSEFAYLNDHPLNHI